MRESPLEDRVSVRQGRTVYRREEALYLKRLAQCPNADMTEPVDFPNKLCTLVAVRLGIGHSRMSYFCNERVSVFHSPLTLSLRA